MKKHVDPETQEIIDSFIAEGYERLDDAEAQLEKLGRGDDQSCLNSVFRLFHSVKGSAGFLGFEKIKLLTHEAEALLEVFLKEKLHATPESVDVILQTIDALRSLVRMVESENGDEGSGELAEEKAAALRSCILTLRAGGKDEGAHAGLRETGTPTTAHEARVAAAPPATRMTTAATRADPSPPPDEAKASNTIELNELVTAEMAQRFLAESADLVDTVEKRAMGISSSARPMDEVNDIFRSIHTIKGNAGFFGHSRLESLCMSLESLMDRARRGEMPVNEALANLVIERIDGIRRTIATVVLVGTEAVEPLPTTKDRPTTPSASEGYKPLGEILVDLGAAREEEIKSALEQQDRPLGQILVDSGAVEPSDIARALDIQKASSGGADRAVVEEIQRKEIRVDTTKLDKLFELVGELITAEAMVLNSPDLIGLKLDLFSKAFSSLNKISREIQETAMMIRMIPLEGLFHKMTRLVRDLSRKFGKPVDFRSSGQETEMDKNVIEQISDPLVHILRNAIDHGLEEPEARERAKKPEAGLVRLDAKYEGSEIWISIKDDGAGLDRERILAKAVEKGMINGDPAVLSDEEVWKMIFEPGFSTAAKVTEVSGRGVGMDVVKKNLERIRGRVDIRTERGNGTEFILKIPLTMAIIDGITIRSGENYYSIPLGDILEFFKLSPEQITETDHGEETVNLRGSILPLIKLGELFNIPGAILDPLAGIVIVVHSAGRRACLLIDEVVGNQQIVVKSLSEYLGKVEGISGCSILGDGTVSFIIDTGKLLSIRLEA